MIAVNDFSKNIQGLCSILAYFVHYGKSSEIDLSIYDILNPYSVNETLHHCLLHHLWLVMIRLAYSKCIDFDCQNGNLDKYSEGANFRASDGVKFFLTEGVRCPISDFGVCCKVSSHWNCHLCRDLLSCRGRSLAPYDIQALSASGWHNLI